MGILTFEEHKKAKQQVKSVEIMMEEKASLVKEAAIPQEEDKNSDEEEISV